MLRVGVIGGGWVSCHRHIPAMIRLGGFQVEGIVGKSNDYVSRVLRKYNIKNLSSSIDEAHWMNHVDLCVIGSPPFQHYEDIKSCLLLNKDVLSEKPMTLSTASANEVIAIAEAQKKQLAVIHNFQFARAVNRAFNGVVHGRFGRVLSLLCLQMSNPSRRLPSWYEQLPLGLFTDESPHFLYLLRLFAGSDLILEDARCTKASNGAQTPNQLTANFSTQSNVKATLYCDFISPVSEWILMILCENALLKIDIFRDILVVQPNDGLHTATNILRNTLMDLYSTSMGFISSGLQWSLGRLDYGNATLFAKFAEGIKSGKIPAMIDARAGLQVVQLQEEIRKACEAK